MVDWVSPKRVTSGVHRYTAALEALCAAARRVDLCCGTVSGHLRLGGEPPGFTFCKTYVVWSLGT